MKVERGGSGGSCRGAGGRGGWAWGRLKVGDGGDGEEGGRMAE